MTDQQTRSPLSRYLTARAPGILFVTAALVLAVSGAAATALPAAIDAPAQPAAPTARVLPAPTADPTPAPTATADGPAATPLLGFKTGDRLTEEQRAEFDAYVAAQQATGGHRGAAYYGSW